MGQWIDQSGGGQTSGEARPEEVVQAVVVRPAGWWPGQWTDQAVGQARGSCPGAGGLVAAEARQWTSRAEVDQAVVARPEEVVQAVVARPEEVVQAVVARRAEVVQAVVAWSLQRSGQWTDQSGGGQASGEARQVVARPVDRPGNEPGQRKLSRCRWPGQW